jgi:flagellar biosynthesis protein FliQ
VLIVLLGPWMLDQLISYIQTLYLSIPQLVSG